jgi:hypothetical protein
MTAEIEAAPIIDIRDVRLHRDRKICCGAFRRWGKTHQRGPRTGRQASVQMLSQHEPGSIGPAACKNLPRPKIRSGSPRHSKGIDMRSHGGPSPQKQFSFCHHGEKPPQARAPHAGWMTVQAGLLTCGSPPFSAFPSINYAQWHSEKELTAYSCGRSCGFG